MITDFYEQFLGAFGVKKDEEEPYLRSGWVCPKCGRVFSPDTFECWYCNGREKSNPSIMDFINNPEPESNNIRVKGVKSNITTTY